MAITLVPALIATIVIESSSVSTPLFIAALVLVFFKSVPLWWRRRRPVAVLVIVVVALLVGELLGLTQIASDGAVIFAAYAVSVYGRPTARLWVVALAALGTVVVFITALTGISPRRESLLTLGPPVLVAWVIGDYIRGRRAFFTELITRHRRESEELRRQAVEDERLRIARELHDVVAHNVSVMAIQAGAARVANTKPSHPLADYVGEYDHPAYGLMKIGLKGEQLQFDFHKIHFPLTHFHYERFDTPDDEQDGKWSVNFATNPEGELDPWGLW